ncbi:MAG: SUMF1/EgtB/PvdO family nonheme iron enzyme [Verrucomicrobia bacterium]|nr:SUMF1/EgtB/PvdO family nonheme iron enzyme [Verrucomicrobiota bacterium]
MSRILPFLAGAAAVLALWGADGSAAFAADEPPFPIDRAAAPLFDDPVWHGAADPSVLWNPLAREFTIYYTQRRATLQNSNGVDWVHGSAIGMATSKDGVQWKYAGICTGDEGLGTPMDQKCSWWAPSVMFNDNQFHLLVSCVDGIYADWTGKRTIKYFISQNGKEWKYRQTLPLSSDNCIDPCVHKIGDQWFVWYKDEGHESKTYAATSPDLQSWKVRGPVITDVPHEAPLVWRWQKAYWLIVDAWDKGLRIYRSDDGIAGWQYNSTILIEPGKRPKDAGRGGHPGILLQGNRVFVFYQVVYAHDRETVLQVAELELDAAGKAVCDRDRHAAKAQAPPEGATITNSLGMKLVRIPAGEFQMGSGESAMDLDDVYGKDYYANPPADDPKGPDTGTERVMRGGGWSGDARHCRSANRFAVVPSGRHSNIGFRVALTADN